MQKRQNGKTGKIKAGLAAAVLLLALIAPVSELFSQTPADPSNTDEIDVSSIELIDFRSEDGSLITQEKNSSFIITTDAVDIGELLIDMQVRESAVTEKVVYYTGTKDGVAGEFVAPLSYVEGRYVAYIDAADVVQIRVFPSEEQNAVVEVHAISVYSGSRQLGYRYDKAIALSLLTAACGIWICNIVSLCTGRRKLLFSAAFSVWSAVSAVLTLAAFMAEQLFTVARSIGKPIVPIALAAFSLIYWIGYLIVFRIRKTENKIFAALVTVGLLFAFCNAPLQVPDENAHFLRAYAIADGALDFNYNQQFPGDVKLLTDCFPGEFYNDVHNKEIGTVLSRISMYRSNAAAAAATTVEMPTTVHLIIPYLFSALAIILTKLVGGTALFCMYAARAANALVFAVAVRWALKGCARHRSALMIFAMLPLTVYIASSVSYDSMFLSAFAVYAGALFSGKIKISRYIAAVLGFAIMIMIKPIYLPMIALTALVPAENWELKTRKVWSILLMVAGALCLWGFAEVYAIFAVTGSADAVQAIWGVDYFAQAMHLLATPFKYLVTILVDGYLKVFYLGQFGAFGCLDVLLPITGFATPIIIIVLSMISRERAEAPKKEYSILLLLPVFMYLLIVTSFYISWSTLGSTSVLGVQARYFLPLIIPVSAVISLFSGRKLTADEKGTAGSAVSYTMMLFMFVSVCELAIAYYLM